MIGFSQTGKGPVLGTAQNDFGKFKPVHEHVDLVEKEPIVALGVKSCDGPRLRFMEEKDVDGLGYNINIDIRLNSKATIQKITGSNSSKFPLIFSLIQFIIFFSTFQLSDWR